MTESISLHGGPSHGDVLTIPDGHNDIEVTVTVLKKGSLRGTRPGHYTRVHSVGGVGTSEFEWSGYTAPFAELEA